MKNYDTIIIGAGLSGCTLGNLLLKKRQKVIIIEQKDILKKDKLCGGLLTKKAYKLLLKIYGEKIKILSFKELNGFKVKNNEKVLEIKKHALYTIPRKDLDDFVIKKFINNGGEILDKVDYDKIDFINKTLYINGNQYKYKNLIGADGVFSKVRYDITSKRQRANFAIEINISKEKENIQIDFLNHFKGFAWQIPNNKHTILGLGNIEQKKDIIDVFLNHFKLPKDSFIRGAYLPMGKSILLKKKKVFFVGDAAGLASPITGEGIYFALASAYELSKSINELYKIRMLKYRFLLASFQISKKLIYNTPLRNFFYYLYPKSKFIRFWVDLALKTIL